jgi:Raf kinase inhibitor-like YbhB/YbcL family protein
MRNIAARLSVVLLAGFVLSGCKSETREPTATNHMQISSTSFSAGGVIPEKYSSYGQNVSPALTWTDVPAGTESIVLLVEDPDAPKPQPFVHWLVYNIPPSTTSIAEGQPPTGVVGTNGTGSIGYYGPKPPSGTHHYHFKVFAVDRQLSLKEGASKEDVMKAIDYHTLGQGEIVATYSH